nr:hypothetical protein GCM10020092_065110 [Actinoplanes digitatis]
MAAPGSMSVMPPSAATVKPDGVFIQAFAEMMENVPASATNGIGSPSRKCVRGLSRRHP